MKKVVFHITAVIVILAWCAMPAEAAEGKYVFGISNILGGEQDAQLKQMQMEFAGIFSDREKIDIEVKWFSDADALGEAIKENKLDFFMPNNWEQIIFGIRHGYQPIVTLSLFNMDKLKLCLYAKKGGEIKEIKDVYGKRLGISTDNFDFFALRKLLGVPLEEVFKSVEIVPNQNSMPYSLAMGKVDVVFMNNWVEEFFKITNPGPVRNMIKIQCADSTSMLPYMYNGKKPGDREMAIRLSDALAKMPRDEAFKKYRPLLRQLKAKAIRVTAEDYRPLVELFDEAYKKGWDKEYEKWIRYAAPDTEKGK